MPAPDRTCCVLVLVLSCVQLVRLDSAAIEQVYKFVQAAAAAGMREFTHFSTHFCIHWPRVIADRGKREVVDADEPADAAGTAN